MRELGRGSGDWKVGMVLEAKAAERIETLFPIAAAGASCAVLRSAVSLQPGLKPMGGIAASAALGPLHHPPSLKGQQGPSPSPPTVTPQGIIEPGWGIAPI